MADDMRVGIRLTADGRGLVREVRSAVYPRERGGTWMASPPVTSVMGLSPRTRGNHASHRYPCPGAGSIPANAGEPFSFRRLGSGTRVYPRERGGTATPTKARPSDGGLSPRTRGNPSSIVAIAILLRVYPRERGGTLNAASTELGSVGLSPRTRGNRSGDRDACSAARSIPANAGEPHCYSLAKCVVGVYPRERGGTPAWCRRLL